MWTKEALTPRKGQAMKRKLRFHVVDNGNQKYNRAKQSFEVLAVATHEGRTWVIALTRWYFPIRGV